MVANLQQQSPAALGPAPRWRGPGPGPGAEVSPVAGQNDVAQYRMLPSASLHR